MKKGFTLIELLAVIVILAIIALIVTPVISKVINGAKQRTAVVGSQNYVDSVNKTYALSMLDSKYDYLKDKDILETGFDDNELNEIEVSGKKPTYIKIEYDKTKNVVKEGKFCVDGISVDYINGVANKSENDYCNKKVEPGLYDKDNNLLFTWDSLINDYGMSLDWYTNDSRKYDMHYEMAGISYGSGVVYDKFYYEGSNSNPVYVEVDDITDSTAPGVILSKSAFANGKKLVVSGKDGVIPEYAFKNLPNIDVIIPSGITKVESFAFAHSKITSVSIGSDVKTINGQSFDNTPNLKAFIMPDTLTEFGYSGEYEGSIYRYGGLVASGVEKVVFSKNISEVPEAFCNNCKNLKIIDISSNIKKIGPRAFESSGLESLTLHEGLESIERYAFDYSPNLKSVKIPNSVTFMGESAFYETGLTSLTIGTGLTEIPASAFQRTFLTNIVIPSNVKKIGDSAFYATAATTVDLGSVEEIGNYAFAYMTNLEEITIPSTVKKTGTGVITGIGDYSAPSKLKRFVFESPNYWTPSNSCTDLGLGGLTPEELAADVVSHPNQSLPAMRHWNSLSECH